MRGPGGNIVTCAQTKSGQTKSGENNVFFCRFVMFGIKHFLGASSTTEITKVVPTASERMCGHTVSTVLLPARVLGWWP